MITIMVNMVYKIIFIFYLRDNGWVPSGYIKKTQIVITILNAIMLIKLIKKYLFMYFNEKLIKSIKMISP